jgi:predicted RNA binding protein YcfA (HicA-like mRNA interferase family)
VNSDQRRLAKHAKKHGWTVTRSKKSHLLFFDPDGNLRATLSGTSSDVRSLKNFAADLRAAGLPLPGKDGRTRERKHA